MKRQQIIADIPLLTLSEDEIMWQDPIVAEVCQAREAHAAQFNFDLQAIYRALKEQEEQSQRKKVSFAPKHIPPIETEIKNLL